MKYILFLSLCMFFLFSNCKKKTSIHVKVYNPRLDEFVANATVLLFENNFALNFGSTTKNISTAVTGANGVAYFDNIKLKTNSKHEYHVVLKDAWGISNSNIYQTESYDGSINKGSSSVFTIYDNEPESTFNIKVNNLFNLALPNDSIKILITSVKLNFTKHSLNYTIGGDTLFTKSISYNSVNSPYPAIITYNPINYKASRLIVEIIKNKTGIMFSSIDTVKVYPNINNTININW